MTRRTFLGLIFTATAVVITESFQFLNPNKRFHTLIKNLFPWLNFDPATIDSFISDYCKYECNTLKSKVKFYRFLILETTPLLHDFLKHRREKRRDYLANKLLLSTDFLEEEWMRIELFNI